MHRARRSTGSRRSWSTSPASAASRLDLPGADLAEQQHQLVVADGEVDVADADGAVVVHGGEPRPAPGCAAGRGRRARAAGRRPCTRSTPGGLAHQVAAAGQPAGGDHPGTGARRLGDHRAGDPAEPVEAVDRAGHQQGGGQPPAAGQQDGPGRRRRRTAPSRSARRRASPAPGARGPRRRRARRPPRAGGACTLGVEAASLTVRTESSAETSERPNRARAAADADAERPATRRPSEEASAEATMTASSTPPASRLCADQRGDRGDREAVDEVDPAVGVAGQPVGVHGAGDDLARRRARQAVLRGLPGEHRGAHPQHHRDPPARVAPEGLGEQQRADHQRDRPGAAVSGHGLPPSCRVTTRWPQIQPVTAPNAPDERGDQEQPDADQAPAAAR